VFKDMGFSVILNKQNEIINLIIDYQIDNFMIEQWITRFFFYVFNLKYIEN